MNNEVQANKQQVQAERAILLDSILARAAEQLGDLHDPVMQHYYRRFPEALAMFEEQGLGHRQKLEAEMIASVLYCIMTWIERPVEVAIVLGTTVPHHGVALHIPIACFAGFTDVVVEEIAATIPEGAHAEAALLAEIRDSLQRETADAASHYQLS